MFWVLVLVALDVEVVDGDGFALSGYCRNCEVNVAIVIRRVVGAGDVRRLEFFQIGQDSHVVTETAYCGPGNGCFKYLEIVL